MKKQIVILGDVELGGGTLTDDFISDRALSKLILELKDQSHSVDLIFNGDTFDFLKCPYVVDGVSRYPRHVNEEIAVAKTKLIYESHTMVFEAMKDFCSKRKNKIFFIIGNHDHDLFFKDVQRQIRTYLGRKINIYFKISYNQHDVYAEHGHQLEILNRINIKRPFMWYKGDIILNYPWVSFGVISRALYLKEEHPFMERVKPYPLLFTHHKKVSRKISWNALKYVIKSVIYYPVLYLRDPTYRMPKDLIGVFINRYRNAHWDVDNITDQFKKKRKRIIDKNKLCVLGHIHEKFLEEKEGKVLIHPDTWRDEYTLDAKTKELTHKNKNYVNILVNDDDRLDWELVELDLKRKKIYFPDIIRDEIKFLKQVAKEEGFNFKL